MIKGVFVSFLQCQSVTDACAAKKRYDDKKSRKTQEKKRTYVFRSFTTHLRKSHTNQIVPINTDTEDNQVAPVPRSAPLSEDEQEHFDDYNNRCESRVEEQYLRDSFGIDHQIPEAGSSKDALTSKSIHVKEMGIDGSLLTRTESSNSIHSMQLKDIFEDVHSDDDETLPTGSSCSSSFYSSFLTEDGSTLDPTIRRISSK